MGEYNRVDAAFYDYYSTGSEGDVQFYVEEAHEFGGSVLELGCGTERTLIQVFLSLGLTVLQRCYR